MVRKISWIIFVGMLLFVASGVNAGSGNEDAAISAALKWLTEIDQGKYSESWNEASEYFKTAVKKEQWVQSLQAVRKPLGKFVARKPISSTYKTSMPGAPDGQYVLLQFQTSFENKKSTIETVTPMLESDGNWRISGYYIK